MFAYRPEGGIHVESQCWVMKALAEYAEGREVDDNDQPSLKSHVAILTVAFISVPVPSTTFVSQLQQTVRRRLSLGPAFNYS
jgi:hypothetical protein